MGVLEKRHSSPAGRSAPRVPAGRGPSDRGSVPRTRVPSPARACRGGDARVRQLPSQAGARGSAAVPFIARNCGPGAAVIAGHGRAPTSTSELSRRLQFSRIDCRPPLKKPLREARGGSANLEKRWHGRRDSNPQPTVLETVSDAAKRCWSLQSRSGGVALRCTGSAPQRRAMPANSLSPQGRRG